MGGLWSRKRYLSIAMGIDLTTVRFKEERQRLRLSHAQIATICGVAKTSVIAWEKGSKIPVEALAALVSANLEFDYQYVVTGIRWGRFGPQDPNLLELSGPDRAKAVLDMALTVQSRLGVEFTKEQLQSLMGYAFEHCPTLDSLEAFSRAAYAVGGQQLPDPEGETKSG